MFVRPSGAVFDISFIVRMTASDSVFGCTAAAVPVPRPVSGWPEPAGETPPVPPPGFWARTK